MTMTTVDLTPRIGTEVKADLPTLLDGSIARELRVLLEQRGVLLFRGLDMSDEQQLQFGKTLGTPRVEHGTDITKVSADKAKSPIFAEYTEGTYFFHFDDTYMEYPALASVLRARTRRAAGRPDRIRQHLCDLRRPARGGAALSRRAAGRPLAGNHPAQGLSQPDRMAALAMGREGDPARPPIRWSGTTAPGASRC